MLNTILHVNYPLYQSSLQFFIRPLNFPPQLADAEKTHMNVVSEEWTSNMDILFLDSVQINKYAISKVIDNAERGFSYSF